MKNVIAKTQNRGGLNTSTTKKTNERGPQQFYFEPPKDRNVMDINSMTTEKRKEEFYNDAAKEGF